jgi:DNA polymerase-3 subunit delta
MKLRPDQIAAQVQKNLLPLYFISGDEPLQVMESSDTVRAAARAQGYTEREVLDADESSFDWQHLLDASNCLSLFAEKRILELRLPSGKPGKQGSEVLQAYASRPAEDAVLIVTAGKLESASKNSKWFKALDDAGAMVQCWPISAAELPRWIEQRMRARKLQPQHDAAVMLAERVEGNLLAAAQEIDKLVLLYGEAPIGAQQILDAVADSARYSIYDWVDAMLSADMPRTVRIADGLQNEGEEPVLALWAMNRELRALLNMSESGLPPDAAVIQARVWDNRKLIVMKALRRHSASRWKMFLKRCARIDRVIKGVEPGRAWDELRVLSAQIAK